MLSQILFSMSCEKLKFKDAGIAIKNALLIYPDSPDIQHLLANLKLRTQGSEGTKSLLNGIVERLLWFFPADYNLVCPDCESG